MRKFKTNYSLQLCWRIFCDAYATEYSFFPPSSPDLWCVYLHGKNKNTFALPRDNVKLKKISRNATAK